MATEEFEEEFDAAECPTCGAIVPADALECTECGQKFEEESEVWEDDEEFIEEEDEEFIEEEDEEFIEEEDDWGDFWEEEAPGKFKLYFGIFLVLFGSLGMGLMSWLHNQLQWNPLGLETYAPNIYGPYDQMFGGSGIVVTIIGIVLIFLWMREIKRYREKLEKPTKGDTEYFEDEEEIVEEEIEFEEAPVEEELEEIACPECGEMNPADSTECWICGFVFEEEFEESEEEEVEEEEEEFEEEEEIRCPNCGTKNEPDAEYCANCEHDLSGGTEIWGED